MSGYPKPAVWEWLDDFPPCYVRVLANAGPEHNTSWRRAISDAEIAIGAGIPLDRVREIKMMTDYSLTTVAEMIAYFRGCNFDPTDAADRKRIRNQEAKCKKRHRIPMAAVRRSPHFQSEVLPVIKFMGSRLRSSAA
jgi:hypothetical protein